MKSKTTTKAARFILGQDGPEAFRVYKIEGDIARRWHGNFISEDAARRLMADLAANTAPLPKWSVPHHLTPNDAVADAYDTACRIAPIIAQATGFADDGWQAAIALADARPWLGDDSEIPF